MPKIPYTSLNCQIFKIDIFQLDFSFTFFFVWKPEIAKLPFFKGTVSEDFCVTFYNKILL